MSRKSFWPLAGAYLITGGLGGIGLEVARWAAKQGARRLILIGRTLLPPRSGWAQVQDTRRVGMIQAIHELEAMGVDVHYASVDVADEKQLRAFLQAYRQEGWPQIRGIFHAAGVIDDRLLMELDAASWQAVMRPKLIGGWLLHELFENEPLDFFVLFSSIGALMGQPGQGNYAAANAFLDALAHYRRACGLPALSINWGPWSNLGFAATAGGQRAIQYLAARGLGSFSAQQGLEVLARLMQSDATQVAVIPIDWVKVAALQAASTRLLCDLVHGWQTSVQASTPIAQKSIRDMLLELEPAQRRSALESHLQSVLAQILRMQPSRIELRMPFGRLGLESLMAVEYRNRLETSLNLSLSATLAWNYPTIADLAPHLASKMDVSLESELPGVPSGFVPPVIPLDYTATQVEDMSDDEAMQALLSRRKGKR